MQIRRFRYCGGTKPSHVEKSFTFKLELESEKEENISSIIVVLLARLRSVESPRPCGQTVHAQSALSQRMHIVPISCLSCSLPQHSRSVRSRRPSWPRTATHHRLSFPRVPRSALSIRVEKASMRTAASASSSSSGGRILWRRPLSSWWFLAATKFEIYSWLNIQRKKYK
jgi:hypothetical protein